MLTSLKILDLLAKRGHLLIIIAISFVWSEFAITKASYNLSDSLDLLGIPAPYCFGQFCTMENGDFWTVGGDGQIICESPDGTTLERQYTHNDLLSIFFVSQREGVVVGTKGLILNTSDGGHFWSVQNSSVNIDLNAVACPEQNYCWAAGRDGVILYTENGGQTWKRAKTPVSKNLLAINFINKQNGWIVGEDGTLLRTGDGGQTWERLQATIPLIPGSKFEKISDLRAVRFFDENIGLVGGLGGIARTTDGGRTWEVKVQEESFIGFVAHGAKDVWAIHNSGRNYCSRDLGLTWIRCLRRE